MSERSSEQPAGLDPATAPYGPFLARVDRLIGHGGIGFQVAMGVAAALGVVASACMYLAVDNEIASQNQRNDFLRDQVAQVDRGIKEIEELEKVKANLLARLKVVDELSKVGAEAVAAFLVELGNRLPGGLVLTKVSGSASQLEITGIARDAARVPEYVAGLRRCAELNVTSLGAAAGGVAFVLSGRVLPECGAAGDVR
jgi:Tfp pilus assembly protein PilN